MIIDNFFTTQDVAAIRYGHEGPTTVNLDGLKVSYIRHIQTDNNSDFILDIHLERYKGGSGKDGKWLKTDMKKFVDNEDKFIKHFTDNKTVPCELIEKKQKDVSYGYPLYDYFFKLLV